MRTVPLLIWFVAWASLGLAQDGNPAKLAVTAEDTAKAEKLIGRLKDDAFDVRKAARAELSEMGWKALPAMEASYEKRANKVERDLAFEALIGSAKRSRFDSAYPIFLVDKDRKF
jgi:hypothetical protein